jgi:hypothetical protein
VNTWTWTRTPNSPHHHHHHYHHIHINITSCCCRQAEALLGNRKKHATMSSSLCLALFVALLCGALTSAKEFDEMVEVKVDLNKPACPSLSVSGVLDGVALPCLDVRHDERKREGERERAKKNDEKTNFFRFSRLSFSCPAVKRVSRGRSGWPMTPPCHSARRCS